jgi:hypothetical protein
VYAGVGSKSSKSLWRNTLRTVSSSRRWLRLASFHMPPAVLGSAQISYQLGVPSAFHRYIDSTRSLRTTRHA